MSTFNYVCIPGHFSHDDVERSPLPAVPERFGLKDSAPDRWETFFQSVRRLNAERPDGVFHKFFLLSRHGQGYHNVAEAKYGTQAWDDYWSKLNGDDKIVWGPDPLLTPTGKDQAHAIQHAWSTETSFGLPPPHRRYCSPLSRALDTSDIIFGTEGIHPHPVLVVENCREENGVHTCDKRKTRSYIESYKPSFAIEDTLTETDELWSKDIRETKKQVAERAEKVLDRIFDENQDEIFISITAHGGWINGFLTAIGRNVYPLPTGGVLPVLVKGTKIPRNDCGSAPNVL
ncbi:hypothetical protein M413DRAFT_438906 [Hebeloma cylindrosporum]|uniref:Phosphoglycerate mutase-like protein n=1 Tax=Hebeloma cylindrosporum TaxID=76867 RepID=A0A0C2YJ23_HEBCY|nr:hypothetical protein M413DRAFT_438906 [Hebeloma cylindrosporum h7]